MILVDFFETFAQVIVDRSAAAPIHNREGEGPSFFFFPDVDCLQCAIGMWDLMIYLRAVGLLEISK